MGDDDDDADDESVQLSGFENTARSGRFGIKRDSSENNQAISNCCCS